MELSSMMICNVL